MKEIGARRVRLLIHVLGALAAGAIKPLFFPEGGPTYAVAAILLLVTFAAFGFLMERWLVSRAGAKWDGGN